MTDYGEPWAITGNCLRTRDDKHISVVPFHAMAGEQDPRYKRMVACVNALKGIEDPEEIPALLKAVHEHTAMIIAKANERES